jgi:hypothetical protein
MGRRNGRAVAVQSDSEMGVWWAGPEQNARAECSWNLGGAAAPIEATGVVVDQRRAPIIGLAAVTCKEP